MKSPFVIGGGIGLGIVLVAMLASALIWLSGPARAIPGGKPDTFPTPDASAAPPSGGEFDQAAQINLIRRILRKPDLVLSYESRQGLTNGASRPAAVYVDPAGSKYYIDLQTSRFAAMEPAPDAGHESASGQVFSMDELRGIATRFAQANSVRLQQLKDSLTYEEGCKLNLCFFRWDGRSLPIDWSGTGWDIMPPFLQIGLSTDGQLFAYNDTLDLFEQTPPVSAPQPTPVEILGGGTVRDGPFDFDLRIFQDPTLTGQPLAPSLYSDLEGFGAYMHWSYTGTEAIGPVTTYWGTEPLLEQLLQASFSSVATGDSGGRTGGILLPGGPMIPGQSKAGDRERLILKVTAPQGDYGAVLVFTLQQGLSGFQPVEISVERLRGQ